MSSELTVAVPDGWTQLAADDQDEVRERVQAYTRALFAGLELPIALDVAIVEHDELPERAVLLEDGRRAIHVAASGGLVADDAVEWADADAYAIHVSRAIWAAREWLIDPDAVARAWRGWARGDELPGLRAKTEVIRQCVRYGFGCGHVAAHLAAREPEQRIDPSTLFDDAIYEPGRVGLALSPRAHAACEPLLAMIDLAAEAVFHERGARFAMRDPIADPALGDDWFQISINDMPLPAERHAAADRDHHVARRIADAVRRTAGAFLTRKLWDGLLQTQLFRFVPQLARAAIAKYGAIRIVQFLRRLADEQLSVRDLPWLLDGLAREPIAMPPEVPRTGIVFGTGMGLTVLRADRHGRPPTPDELAEAVRATLKRALSHWYTRGGNTLHAFLVDRRLEAALELGGSERDDAGDTVCAALRDKLADHAANRPVVLVDAAARLPLRRVLELEFPDVPVLCYSDLTPDLNLLPLARLGG